MNKSSHISLSLYMLERDALKDQNLHRRSFLIGSILPDCLPSFLTTRHTMPETFSLLKSEILKISIHYNRERKVTKYFSIHFGMIMHYLADYFTMPHNPGFEGTMKEHIEYERKLCNSMQRFINGDMPIPEEAELETAEQLFDYIVKLHHVYLNEEKNLWTDCKYITKVCNHVAVGIIMLLSMDVVSRDMVQEIAA